ncbi:MAG: molybdopterin-guanine dinucleotide biosynthesis protein B [Anaerolineae bacterium]|nr:molybdopterin-guanine dinucleotide biosynthesis protein B [Anaerolineae bacterium]
MIPVVSVIGWHNVGKTALIEELVRILRSRGFRVAVIKHTRGDFQLDREGTDTWRFAQAGADVVVISGKQQVAFIENRVREARLEEIVERLPQSIDIVITEGFKRERTLKIEVLRSWEERITSDSEALALVCPNGGIREQTIVPCFSPEEVAQVAELIVEKFGLGR